MSYASAGGPWAWRAKEWVKRTLVPVADRLGAFDAGLARLQAQPQAWTILMYHRIIVDQREDPFHLGMCVRVEHFDAQIQYLRKNFNPMSVSDATARLRRGDALPAGTVSVTFDDGYLDNLTHALPVLQRYEMPMSLYVATGGMHENEPFWWDRAISALDAWPDAELDPASLDLPGLPQPLPMRSHLKRHSVERILDALWALPIERATAVVARLQDRASTRKSRVRPPARLGTEGLRKMTKAGITIGAHTVCHPNLTLMTPEIARDEMMVSRTELQSLLDLPIEGFAYPGGRVDANMCAIAKSCGFEHAVGTMSGINFGDHDLYQLSRVGANDSALPDFKRALKAHASHLVLS